MEACFDADDNPAVGDTRWFDAAAAMGTEKRDRKRVEVARRKLEANTLAVVVFYVKVGVGPVVGF